MCHSDAHVCCAWCVVLPVVLRCLFGSYIAAAIACVLPMRTRVVLGVSCSQLFSVACLVHNLNLIVTEDATI
jgi:hypothetical protein